MDEIFPQKDGFMIVGHRIFETSASDSRNSNYGKTPKAESRLIQGCGGSGLGKQHLRVAPETLADKPRKRLRGDRKMMRRERVNPVLWRSPGLSKPTNRPRIQEAGSNGLVGSFSLRFGCGN
jgi:hypothetical protein